MLCRIHRGDLPGASATWPSAHVVPPSESQQTPGPETVAADARLVEDYERKLAHLKQSVEAELRQAHQAGFAEGRQAAVADLEPVVARLGRSIDTISEMRTKLRKQAEADVVKLSLAIARRVLHREVNADPEALQGLVSYLLNQISSRESCRLRFHPAHETLLRKHLASIPRERLEIAPDPALAPGDVLLETDRGTIDGSVDTQLGEIERGFIERLGR